MQSVYLQRIMKINDFTDVGKTNPITNPIKPNFKRGTHAARRNVLAVLAIFRAGGMAYLVF